MDDFWDKIEALLEAAVGVTQDEGLRFEDFNGTIERLRLAVADLDEFISD